ncbi:MAG: murein L,D-transpeptidase [Acidimicrobiia bacterium]|nr:murein L,D-transpeptidase [Acidimicrobiia bacterium]
MWAVDDNNVLIRSWLVSGSKYDNEIPGTYKVYSRSDVSTSWNGESVQYKMVRWLKSDRAPIGFHSIPLHIEDKTPYQDEAALGERLSDGCQRQATLDADFTWEFAQIGTVVVVI